MGFVLFLLTNQNNLKVRPCRAQSVFGCKFEMASRSTSRSSSTRRKNTDGKNAQSSNKDTQYGKKDAEAINIDVQQSIPSSGPFMNDAEQCTPSNTDALKSKMESRSTEQESLIGYVQNLSPLKRNRKNTLDYASMTLQTASGNREVLLYSPPKRSLLLESEKSRRPIKVSCLTSTPDRKKLIINDMTKVSFPESSEYSFQFEDVRLATPDPMTILQVLNESDEWNLVTVKGKVLTVKDAVIVGERKLKLAEAIFADASGSIGLDIWEAMIDTIKEGNCYCLSNVQVRLWSGKKKLSTSFRTTVSSITDETATVNISPSFAGVEPESIVVESVTSNVEIFSIEKVERFLKCLNCKKKIIQVSSSLVVHCDRCGHTMKTVRCSIGFCARVLVDTDKGNRITLKLFEDVLQKVIGDDLCELNESEVATKLLLFDNVHVKYDSSSGTVSELTLNE